MTSAGFFNSELPFFLPFEVEEMISLGFLMTSTLDFSASGLTVGFVSTTNVGADDTCGCSFGLKYVVC